ncbi:response regulator [Planctomycetota bacterium]
MRILVIDDSKVARLVVKKVLREIGYTDVTEASNGNEGLALVKDRPFDLIISDWLMPGLDGLGFVKAVQQTPSRTVPIIMVTSESDVSRIVEILQAGAQAYVRKPFSPEMLRAKITEVRKKIQLAQTSAFTVLSGSLAEVGFPELVQFLSAQRAEGRLQISSERRTGEVEFRTGEVRDATCGDLVGDEAFFELAGLGEGTFKFERRSGAIEKTLSMETLPLLIEALRVRDERAEAARGG